MEALLGSKLLTKTGDSDTATALAGAEVVAIYFSAHWCPPCRGFTPQLASRYEALKKEHGAKFECVFASSDRDEAAFSEYYAEMPWLSLPYADRAGKEALSKKYKVQGIPTLVLVDAKDGSLITKDGRSVVMAADYTLAWRQPTLADLLPDDLELIIGDGTETEKLGDVRARTTHIGIYFSAHWCPPCRGFTPDLVKKYKIVKEAGKKFEVIFVSSDRDEGSFDEYFGEMPWAALPYAQRGLKDSLSNHFGVQGIPSFVMLDSAGFSVVNAEARGAVSADKSGDNFPWEPPLAANVDEDPSGINDTATVIALFEEAPDEWDGVTAALRSVSAEYRAEAQASGEDQAVLFMYAEDPDGLGSRLRGICNLPKAKDGQMNLVLVDVPNRCYSTAPAGCNTAGGIKAFAADYRAGKLETQGLNM